MWDTVMKLVKALLSIFFPDKGSTGDVTQQTAQNIEQSHQEEQDAKNDAQNAANNSQAGNMDTDVFGSASYKKE